MLETTPIIAFIATTDFSRAREFYVDLLGLKLVAESSFALELDAAGTMLRVTKVGEVRPAPYTVLGWRVPDIVKAMKTLQGKGIIFDRYPGMEQDELGIWASPIGARVAWFKDPDGNVLSLAEFASG
jgi:catechol 2,3-dioxygenase-like lactoylglutathione lyase family enzyme